MEAEMDLKQLRYFTTVAEEGTISAAAKKLFMSQPPLSTQMKLLEQELGCTLFIRTRKGAGPKPEDSFTTAHRRSCAWKRQCGRTWRRAPEPRKIRYE